MSPLPARMAHETPTDDTVGRSAAAAWRRTLALSVGIIVVDFSVIALLWSIIVSAIYTERSAAIERARSEANHLSAAFQAEVGRKLDAISDAMGIVADQFQQDPNFDIFAWARANPLLVATFIRSIDIVSRDGRLIGSTLSPHSTTVDLSDRDYVQAQVQPHPPELFIGQVVRRPSTKEASIHIARRATTADGSFIGLVVCHVAPTDLTNLPRLLGLNSHDYLTLIGTDNVIRARFGADSPNGDTGVGNVVPGPVFAPAPGAEVQTYVRSAVVDQRPRLYSVRQLERYPLYVSVGFDLDRILQPAAARAKSLMAVGGIATLMLAGLATLLIIQLGRLTDREVRLRAEQGRLAAEIRSGMRVHAQLRASETRLSDFAKVASDWFWEQDADLRFISIGVGSPIGVSPVSYLGKRRWELGDPSESPEYWAAHQREVEAHNPFKDFRYCRTGSDGTPHYVSISGVPVFDDAGRFTGYRGTGRDITSEVTAARELHAAKSRAEQAETLLRDAVDSMSEGFVIYDSEDRLVMCNDRFLQLYSCSAEQMVSGTKFLDQIRGGLARGEFIEAAGREAVWLRERDQQFRDHQGSVERRLKNGRWVLVTDRRMRNGGLAGLRIDVTTLKQTEAALAESEARLDRAQAIAGIGSWELDVATGRYTWSKELYRIRGVTPGELPPSVDNITSFVHPDDFPAIVRWLMNLRMGVAQPARDARIIRPDGEERVVRVEGRSVTDADGVIRRLAGTMQDITERCLMERQLMQAQKMEAIGNLTGGMAHDFNNGLGIIIGNLDLLARLIHGNAEAEELCEEVRGGARRCAELVRSLLAFARRQPLRPQQTDVNALVEQTIRMLDRTLGQHITLTSRLSADAWPVLADPVQLEAALVNLATNARDAMPNGGQLDISTRNIELDVDYVALYPEVEPGAFVLIEVSDTGTGIPPELLNRIFDPFFTTKAPGQGSGLGLSMVFGFAKQSGGHLTVYSEPGRGSTFRIYLPRAEQATSQEAQPCGHPAAAGRHEPILMVEDNEHLRLSTARVLAELGYHVIDVPDAATALTILAGPQPIELLFSDVMMPGEMDGVGLARRAVQLRPGLRVLLTSGLLTAQSLGRQISVTEFRLLNKPYQRSDLAQALRDVLDATTEQSHEITTDSVAG